MSLASFDFSPSMTLSYFAERPNRFIIKCILASKGTEIEAHLPDSGRLTELLKPGAEIYLLPNNNPERKTAYSAVCVKRPDGKGWVSLNSTVPNRLSGLALKNNLLPSFEKWNYVRSEFTKGKSRWDHLLETDSGEKMVVEVKGVTLTDNNQTGYFPDAVTARGTKHVLELIDINEEKGWHAALLFVAQRSDIKELKPADWIDPAFSRAMRKADSAGVLTAACRCDVSPRGMRLTDEIPVVLDKPADKL
ncbi:DNA/RNA nuclease SfsA [Salipaludibacillus sp. CUR1]|uniref:DNA/RNA nuclease SfsA n=1 Tax=Salipaludibacillus sp. CUR1 TaxID=2820003 RepID=UPI001E42D2C6|nr:DNA/RNA nuclease SfsA [Salipaludibacillus sp. CUR1]MCE7793608.1 DNA/RNA nuclease SfsA [Salipaludibacillus sp. CUR1]